MLDYCMHEESIKSEFHLIGLSEVWSVPDTDILGLKGYNLEVSCRGPEMRGGGVGVYVHSLIKYKMLSYNIVNAESIWLEVATDDFTVVVGIIYRKPNTDITEFQQSLVCTLDQMKVDRRKCILLGDFNIDIHISGNYADMFLTSLTCLGMHQLIQSPTRVTSSSKSLIDHIYSNMSVNSVYAGIIITDISDHFATFALFEHMPVQNQGNDKVHRRNYRKYNKDNFCENLLTASWEPVYRCTNVNDAYNIFMEVFVDICDRHAPVVDQSFLRRRNNKPWITKGIKKSIKTKHKLFGKVVKSDHNEIHVSKYKKYRNLLTTTLRNAKRSYYSEQFEVYSKDTKQTWKSINTLLKSGNNNCRATHVEKLCVLESGNKKDVTDVNEISDVFNDFFVNIGRNLASSIIHIPGNMNYNEYLDNEVEGSMFWNPVTSFEVNDHLLSLERNKACGFDNVPAQLLKDAADLIASPLAYIFNQSLSLGVFPEMMKVAKVTPIYKKGQKDVPGNYRPISVLPLLAKVF